MQNGFSVIQSLLRRRLNKALLDLFHQCTGLRLHPWWHNPGDASPPSALLKLCLPARTRGSAGHLQTCEECLRTRWPQDWRDFRPEKRFECRCGLTSFYTCLKIQDQPALTLVVQQPRSASRDARRTFARAVRLARLILHDLKGTLEASRAAVKLEPQPHNGNHRQQLVQRMLDFVHEHYSQPLQLHDVAAAMNLNASYVSSLFSSTLGVTFHHYLEEYRLAQAKELLRDPVKRISEVAYAVGYSNPNHFRNVFTTSLGLPPSAWRETSGADSEPTADLTAP